MLIESELKKLEIQVQFLKMSRDNQFHLSDGPVKDDKDKEAGTQSGADQGLELMTLCAVWA